MITESKSKLMVDLNIDVGGLAACSYNTKDAFFNVEGIVDGKSDQQVTTRSFMSSGLRVDNL